jgi:hypothetical protein
MTADRGTWHRPHRAIAATLDATAVDSALNEAKLSSLWDEHHAPTGDPQQ